VDGVWSQPPGTRRFWGDVLIGVLAALVLGTVLKTFVLGAVYVPSGSMEGTLLPGDYVLVNKLSHSLQRTRVGDVIVFHPPLGAASSGSGEGVLFLKRCIATGGDTVEIAGGRITVNGRRLLLPGTAALWREPEAGFGAPAAQRIVVPPGHLFLLGDNPSASSDSRAWGCVPENNVVGAAALVYWSIRPLQSSGSGNNGDGAIRWSRIGTILR
jgi:signal peptidase I